MIPLAAWLEIQEQASGKRHDKLNERSNSADIRRADDDAPSQCTSLLGADDSVQIKELERQLVKLENELETIQKSYESLSLEYQILKDNSDWCQLTQSIQEAIANGFASFEFSLLDILQPFIQQQVRSKAVDDLVLILKEAIRDSSENVVEVRAPKILHETLCLALETDGLTIRIVEAESVQICSATYTSHFKELTKDWLDQLNGAIKS